MLATSQALAPMAGSRLLGGCWRPGNGKGFMGIIVPVAPATRSGSGTGPLYESSLRLQNIPRRAQPPRKKAYINYKAGACRPQTADTLIYFFSNADATQTSMAKVTGLGQPMLAPDPSVFLLKPDLLFHYMKGDA